MEFNVELKRLEELVKAFQDAPAIVKTELRQGLREALAKVQERARKEHRFRTKTGNLERSIQTQVISDWPPTGRVWLNPSVAQTKNGLSYGLFQHEGTKHHPVAPVDKKALRWVGSNGAFWFSKGHEVSGIKPDPFIYKAAEFERENINKIFNRRIDEAIKKAFVKLARGV